MEWGGGIRGGLFGSAAPKEAPSSLFGGVGGDAPKTTSLFGGAAGGGSGGSAPPYYSCIL